MPCYWSFLSSLGVSVLELENGHLSSLLASLSDAFTAGFGCDNTLNLTNNG
jgi:hypothetical protein